jgi:vacuolar-type H+-ATPase subunit E/Vma4
VEEIPEQVEESPEQVANSLKEWLRSVVVQPLLKVAGGLALLAWLLLVMEKGKLAVVMGKRMKYLLRSKKVLRTA